MNDDKTQLVGGGGFDPYQNSPAPPQTPFDPYKTQMAPPPVMAQSPPVIAASAALSLTVRVGNRYANANERTRQHVLTQISAGSPGTNGSGANFGANAGGGRLPVNVALVIDRSGSMEGEPLEYVKRACSYVVDLLSPDDVLSIVTFEETVDVLMPARRVANPDLIKQHIARIVPGNTTNLFDGLYAGGAQAASVPLAGYVTRVLLLTDGEPTAGLRDFQSIVNQVGDLKARGVTVTALGFGPEYNEELMAGIARKSGGNYYYIARPEEIPDVFRREMQTILGVTARNVKLTFDLPRGCSVRQVYGSPPQFGPRSAQISLGDMEGGVGVSKLWEMDWEPRRTSTYRVAKAILSWDDGNAPGQSKTQSANVVVEFIGDAARVASGTDPIVVQELSVAQAGRDLEKTMMGMRTQQLSSADLTQALQKTQMLLTQQGRVEAAREVQQAVQAAQSGDDSGFEKTLIGTIYHLDQGRR